MPEILIHNKTKTVFQLTAKNKIKYRTDSGAVFPIHECEEWRENYPQLAYEMPPELGQVVSHGEHVFIVVRRAIDKETGQKRLWYCDIKIKSCGYYPLEDCSIVSDELIEGWVEAIALHRFYKEDSSEYQAFIKRVPASIRDLCIVRSFNKVLNLLPVPPEVNGCF